MRPTDPDSGLPVARINEAMSSGGADAWRVHYTALQRRGRDDDVIVLSVGDPDFDTPRAIVEEAKAALSDGDTHYTVSGGVGPLASAVAALESGRLGVPLDASQVVTSIGAQNALYCIFRCLLEPGDEALLLSPPYTMFAGLAGACGAQVLTAPLDEARGFTLDVDAVAAALTPSTRMVLANFPHNPSGAMPAPDDLRALVDLCRERGIWLVSDEAYCDLVYDGVFESPASFSGDTAHVIVVRSLSKSHAMSGWRVGWIVTTSGLARQLRNLISHVSYGSPEFIQRAAVTALTAQLPEVAQMKAAYHERRDALVEALASVPGFRVVIPPAGIFCLVDVSGTGLGGEAFSERLLDETGVSVLMGSAFAPSIANYVRISLCEPVPRLLEAVRRMRAFVDTL